MYDSEGIISLIGFQPCITMSQEKKSQKDIQIQQQKIQGFHRPPSQNIFFNETSISHWKVHAFREPALIDPIDILTRISSVLI